MGQLKTSGDYDERPVHSVTITKPFAMGMFEVTNKQYELFDPAHKKLRGKHGLSKDDNEAVIYISWYDAQAFCNWLSDQEGQSYRLPTEAEWEYACRAGTTTSYSTADFPGQKSAKQTGRARLPKLLHVGKTTPNPWGLYDMHGNVEEWCYDWYGPYEKGAQINPVGRIVGDSRVIRGGSHSTKVEYLRSANRSGALPADEHWLLGFRVVMGEMPKTRPLPETRPKLCMENVSQKKFDWLASKVDMSSPFFKGPDRYLIEPANPEEVPMFGHNHCPSITWCNNGDLLAVWFSCINENGREMTILGSRFRAGSDKWDEASEFYNVPDRNMTGSALINDNKGRLYFFNGVSVASSYRTNNALIMRTSNDSGATWSRTRLINPVRGISSQPIGSAYCTEDGRLVVPSDWPWSNKDGGTGLWISADRGMSWSFSETEIRGIHAGVVNLTDGSFMALGRRRSENLPTPMSISNDGGNTWNYSITKFPRIGGGQRLVLRRLKEGPLLLISFTGMRKKQSSMLILDKAGKEREVYGMYAALSFDDGKTWPVMKLITAGGEARKLDGGAWTREFTMDDNHAEPAGYLAGIQTPDGIFHLLSSALHYQFNLAWLKEPMPAAGNP
jgi:hypothetical protein